MSNNPRSLWYSLITTKNSQQTRQLLMKTISQIARSPSPECWRDQAFWARSWASGGAQFERHDHLHGVHALLGGISAQRGGEGRLLTKLSPIHIFEEAKHNKKARFRGQNRQKTATPFKIWSAFLPQFFPQIGEEWNAPYKTKTIYCICKHIPYTIYGIRGWGSWIRKERNSDCSPQARSAASRKREPSAGQRSARARQQRMTESEANWLLEKQPFFPCFEPENTVFCAFLQKVSPINEYHWWNALHWYICSDYCLLDLKRLTDFDNAQKWGIFKQKSLKIARF